MLRNSSKLLRLISDLNPPEFVNLIDSTVPSKANDVLVTRPGKGFLWQSQNVALKFKRVKFRKYTFPSIKRITKFLEFEQASDIVSLDIRNYSQNTPYSTLIVATGFSGRHLSRIGYSLVKSLREAQVPESKYFSVDGQRDSEWMLVCMKDLVVHLMTEETRSEIDLIEAWKNPTTEEEIQEYLLNKFRK